MISVVIEKSVGGQMTVNKDLEMSLLLGFVHVFGGRHRQHPQHNTQETREKPGYSHECMVFRPVHLHQTSAQFD